MLVMRIYNHFATILQFVILVVTVTKMIEVVCIIVFILLYMVLTIVQQAIDYQFTNIISTTTTYTSTRPGIINSIYIVQQLLYIYIINRYLYITASVIITTTIAISVRLNNAAIIFYYSQRYLSLGRRALLPDYIIIQSSSSLSSSSSSLSIAFFARMLATHIMAYI